MLFRPVRNLFAPIFSIVFLVIPALAFAASPTVDEAADLKRFHLAESIGQARLAAFDELDFEVYTHQKWSRFKETHAENIQVHMPDGRVIHGLHDHIEDVKGMFVWAPDTRIREHPVRIFNGEWTSVVGVLEGTFTKKMKAGSKTIEPTGKPFRIVMSTVAHWKDGLMDEEYLFWDNLTLMQQIGIAPPQ